MRPSFLVAHSPGRRVIRPTIPGTGENGRTRNRKVAKSWSRRGELNAPSVDYDSTALPIELHRLMNDLKREYHLPRRATPVVSMLLGKMPSRPRCSPVARHSLPHGVSGT